MAIQQGTEASADAVVGFDPELIHDGFVTQHFAAPAPPQPAAPADVAPVWVSDSVPGYHVSSQCSALLFDVVDPRGSDAGVRKMTRDDAKAAGLDMCKWCAAWRQMLIA